MKSQLLYYYFSNMDGLVLAVLQRIRDRRQKYFEVALASPNPLEAMWELSRDPAGAIVSAELIALAGHREAIRAEIVRNASEFRTQQVAVVSRLLTERGVDLNLYPAEALVMIWTALARAIVTENALGLTDCHQEAQAIVERLIRSLSVRLVDGHGAIDGMPQR